jgi:DNA repair exonuclease SbcCD ATPase subunit
MTTKSELIGKLESLLEQEEIESLSEQVESLKASYEALFKAEEENDPEDVNTEEEPTEAEESEEQPSESTEPSDSEPEQPIESARDLDEDDKRFKHLVDTYNQKVNELRKARLAEEKKNLEKKREIIARLDELISQEENIGVAFNSFKEIQEEWKTIGNIPQKEYRDVQKEYSDKLDTFFYNIRIYKELREHDLKRNAGLKEALASDMEALVNAPSIKEMEVKIKEYQEQWKEIGPVMKEQWEEIGDRFWNATRAVYDKIHEHYKAKRAVQEENLAKKGELIEKVKSVIEQTTDVGAKEWKKLTDEVLALQNDWKKIGFASKKDNERVWKEFRETCNVFFDKKQEFYGELKEVFSAAKEKKEALIAQAEALKSSTDWKETADALKSLQNEWKKIGSAGHRHEHKLWNSFRAACDAFFGARKKHFDEEEKSQAGNLAGKKALLQEMKAFELSGNKGKDLAMLREFSSKWNELGRIPAKNAKTMIPQYRSILDDLYGKLDISEGEKLKERLQDKVESIKGAGDPKKQFEHEKRQINRKISFLEKDIIQYERNLAMFNFKSASGEAMKKDIEKKMDHARRDIDQLRKQQKEMSAMLKENKDA